MSLTTTPADTRRAPTLSLVLGSGGARGYAHIGVIEELEAQGFRIASISGSSMGALVGGVYATGKLADYRDWVLPLERMDVFRLLDWTLSGGGFIKGNRIIGALRELVGETNIEDLSIPYTAVAVDLDAQREVWFSRGPLFDAVRASIAIPTVFRPYHYQGRLLVDGGLLNPLPVSPTLRDHTDYTLAIDLNGQPDPALDPDHGATPVAGEDLAAKDNRQSLIDRLLPNNGDDRTPTRPTPRDPGYAERLKHFFSSLPGLGGEAGKRAPEPGMFDLFARSLDTVQETITRLKLAAQPPDLVIEIPRNACAFYEFHRAGEMIELGHRCTREALARWRPKVPSSPQV